MRYHLAKKHSARSATTVHICKVCDEDYQSSYILRKDKWRDDGAQRGSRAQNVDFTNLMGHVDDNNQTQKLFLVDSEMGNGRQTVFIFGIDTLEPKFLLERSVVVFNSVKCAANPKVALGFVLENVGDGSCRFYYAHEKRTLLE